MNRTTLSTLLLTLPLAAAAQAPARDAESLAKEILKKGAATFDERNAPRMAATFADDGKIVIVGKDPETGEYRELIRKEGRTEIQEFYRGVFGDGVGKATSRNNVEFARLVAPDLLVIHGTFEPDVEARDKVAFVQERVKQGDAWLVLNLRIYRKPE
ncbi:MAG TPA: hypothetical protein VG406_04315 [Isosphaeraceae bacterium]|jgi:hypothetical protein|nr:hypothetical protein [Isosphaeraceae bacterium]